MNKYNTITADTIILYNSILYFNVFRHDYSRKLGFRMRFTKKRLQQEIQSKK